VRSQRLLVARIHLAFVDALEARALDEVARRDVGLAARLHELGQRRLERGAGTQLDVNVAAAELGRAEARLQSAEAGYHAARAFLAEVIGADPTAAPAPAGELAAALGAPPAVQALVAGARAHRADLQSLRAAESASRHRHALAQAEAWPNLTVRAFIGREDETDTLIGGAVAVPLPLFDRNQGPVAEAAAATRRARAEREAGDFAVAREIVAAHGAYRAGVATAARLRQRVLVTLEQNLDLLERAFDAGKLTFPEVLLIRRSFVDAQRDLTMAEAQARRAWIELQVAAGKMPVPHAAAGARETIR
jgi:cobalt-zinc-cadmium efflux system outer membrane protein